MVALLTAAHLVTTAAVIATVEVLSAAVVTVLDTPVDELIVDVVFGCCDGLLILFLLLLWPS